MKIRIKEMKRSHINEVLKIEKDSFKNNAWDERFFLYILNDKSNFAYVFQDDDAIIGYIIAHVFRPWATILNIAVRKRSRRQGYAQILINFIKEKLKGEQCHEVFLEVRKSNVKAKNLYKKLGFQFLNTVIQYYENGEDALVMGKII
ncbi:MAG: ribosomal protein S18-alanine N-acetyltransferase [Spirochaetes bacterium]|nr:ribosomal protein S18-alanine N-acetyltransferase [Spirochaetota bacterium]